MTTGRSALGSIDANGRPLPVAIAALLHEGRILLIRRTRGDYPGLWGLPGGKIERDEHLSAAAVREIREESGIESVFEMYLGCVSEHLVEGGRVARHFLLHLCALKPLGTELGRGAEGELRWFPLAEIGAPSSDIIPSDRLIIERMVVGRGKNYYDCVLEKTGDAHVLIRFS